MNKNLILAVIVALSFMLGFLEVITELKESSVSDSTYLAWSVIFIVLSAIWVVRDSERDDFEKPFELGFLIYVLWPITLPWYLVSTRGAEGLLLFFGLVALYVGPWVAGLVTYAYYT